MTIPELGELTVDPRFGWYYSAPIDIPILGQKCRFVLEGYNEDVRKEDFHTAIHNLLAADHSVLQAAEAHIYNYYKDCNAYQGPDDDQFVEIASPREIWKYIRLGNEPMVVRGDGGKEVYISLECNCDWEREHGLQIVFQNGLKVTKVGPYDGHMTNSHAYGDPRFVDVVYRRRG